ncbi:MAG: hypothetical protein LBR97_03190 [Dysgonamonadaceae bacterium]|nr:hypothetical protein [Dysgonamonadaceae bacterium]
MKKNNITLDSIEKTDPFKVPEDYFENFTADIMSKLPDLPVEQPKVISLWERVQPWIYMAAMFAGIALMINLFVDKPDSRQEKESIYASEGLHLNSSNDIEDFYRYYEDELIKVVYDDAMTGLLGDAEIGYIQ